MMFCSIVGHASFQTAGPMGPSIIERSNFLCFVPTCVTDCEVYYAAAGRPFHPILDAIVLGRDGNSLLTGFSPRKHELVLYLGPGIENKQLMAKLGKHKAGKGCLYVKALDGRDRHRSAAIRSARPPIFSLARRDRQFSGPMRKTTLSTNRSAWRSISSFISRL
jgi:hypothetical protein